MLGYHGKLLEVDLSKGKTRIIEVEDEILENYVGGRGLATYILWDRLGDRWEEVDPLGPDNILTLLTGPLTGFYPGAKMIVSGKSPQSNGIIGSAISSEAAVEIRAAGYDGILVTGASKDPVYILVDGEDVEVRDASKYWGMRGRELIRELMRDLYPEIIERHKLEGVVKEPSILYVGPAGENMVRTASVMSKYVHAAGYGGYGAVMGSKKLKAVVVKGYGPMPEVKDPEKLKSLIWLAVEKLSKRGRIRDWGTGAGGYVVGYEMSSEPVKNWQEEWHDKSEIGVYSYDSRIWVKKYWGDYGCPTTCMKLSLIRWGDYKGSLTDAPDYEMQAYLGPNLGVFNPEEVVYLSALADDLGLCGINTGNVLGFIAELYQRGIISVEELDGIKLEWGDARGFAKLMLKMAYREGVGELLAEGTYRCAVRLGEVKNQDLLKYAVQVKGVSVGAHGIRSKLDYPDPMSYAVSTQGGDHTSTAHLPLERGEGETILYDSSVICFFNALPDVIWDFYRAVTGWDMDWNVWNKKVALRVLAIQRGALLLGGPDVSWDPRVHDDNPEKFYEPLPSGPKAGSRADREEVERLKQEYYKAVGWDEYGIPKSSLLAEYGLQNLDKKLEGLRARLKRRL